MKKQFLPLIAVAFAACTSSADQKDKSTGTGTTSSFSTQNKRVIVYTTADSSNLRLTATDTLSFQQMGQPFETQTCVFVDPSKTFQTFLGIGGALTDASAETWAKLPKEKQDELIKAYYDPTSGIGYTLGRTNIHSCDFSSGSYTYVDEGDKELKTFSVKHDEQFRIPFIKAANAAAGGKLTLYGSPWSPPAFMKTTNNMLQGGKLKPEFYDAWALYYTKFIKAYEAAGIPIWGISIQNEPMAKQTWESCIYTAEEERDFLKKHLGPTMHKEGLQDKKIIAWDHNRDLLYQRASIMLNDPEARKYLWGIGFHWYEDWSGGQPMFGNVAKVKEAYPDVNLLFTEGCNGPYKFDGMMQWKLGEVYGRSMINDFNHGTVGWTDWNILLDETGGPNHVKNFCYAPIHGDTRNGSLIYTNAYYYIGHFSKFIRPGAKRVMTTPSRSSLLSTSFLNEDGKLVTVVMNGGDTEVTYFLWIDGMATEVKAKPHSIATLVVN